MSAGARRVAGWTDGWLASAITSHVVMAYVVLCIIYFSCICGCVCVCVVDYLVVSLFKLYHGIYCMLQVVEVYHV